MYRHPYANPGIYHDSDYSSSSQKHETTTINDSRFLSQSQTAPNAAPYSYHSFIAMASRSSFFSDPRPQRRRSVSPPGRSAFSLPDARERKREAARKRVRYDFGHTQRVMTLGDEDGDNTSGASVDDSGFANKDGKHTVTNEDDQVERFRLKRALKGLTRRTRKGLLHLCNALIPRPRLPPSLSTHQTSNGIQYLTPNRDRFPSNPEKDLNAYTNPYPYSGRAR